MGIVNTPWPTAKQSGSHALFRPEDARAVVVFPRQMRDSDNWSRVSVMNIANEEVAVRVDFYDTNGGRVYRHPDMELDAGEAVVLNTASLLGGHFEGTAVAYSVPLIRPAPQTDIPIRPSLVGVGDLMYSDGHADGNRAAIYEGIGQ